MTDRLIVATFNSAHDVASAIKNVICQSAPATMSLGIWRRFLRSTLSDKWPISKVARGKVSRHAGDRTSAWPRTSDQGALIFVDNCAACNGDGGKGMTTTTSGAPAAPPVVGDIERNGMDDTTLTIANLLAQTRPRCLITSVV
jgi:hypothetical protein